MAESDNSSMIYELIDKIDSELKKKDDKFYENQKRRGLTVIPWVQLMQYRTYLKGFYFHAVGKYNDAIYYYTESLKVAEKISVNFWRL